MYRAVSDNEIAAYRDMVVGLARQYTRSPYVEQDDLVQEGLVDVWLSLRRGNQPNPEFIKKRMRRYSNKLKRQRVP